MGAAFCVSQGLDAHHKSLCIPSASKTGTPRFERYAWLSEKENDTQERWYRKNKKLYAYLFRRVKMEPSNDEWKLADKWREEDDTLFAKLYGVSWPENTEEKAVKL